MSQAEQRTKVALFPIPEMVSFPGTKVPLHVFEPRYRSMINHCIEHQMMLGVAHTSKALNPKGAPTQAPKTAKQKLEETLQTNQTSYEPHQIFSAGPVKLIEQTEDGRLYIEVTFIERLQLLTTTQEVPFKIAECQFLTDAADVDPAATQQLASDINQLLLAISKAHSPELNELMQQPAWQQLTPAEFSYQLFTYFKFDAEFMQAALEQTSVMARLEHVWQGLNDKLAQ